MRRFPTRNDGPLQSNNCFKDAGPVLRERRFGLGGSVPAALSGLLRGPCALMLRAPFPAR